MRRVAAGIVKPSRQRSGAWRIPGNRCRSSRPPHPSRQVARHQFWLRFPSGGFDYFTEARLGFPNAPVAGQGYTRREIGPAGGFRGGHFLSRGRWPSSPVRAPRGLTTARLRAKSVASDVAAARGCLPLDQSVHSKSARTARAGASRTWISCYPEIPSADAREAGRRWVSRLDK